MKGNQFKDQHINPMSQSTKQQQQTIQSKSLDLRPKMQSTIKRLVFQEKIVLSTRSLFKTQVYALLDDDAIIHLGSKKDIQLTEQTLKTNYDCNFGLTSKYKIVRVVSVKGKSKILRLFIDTSVFTPQDSITGDEIESDIQTSAFRLKEQKGRESDSGASNTPKRSTDVGTQTFDFNQKPNVGLFGELLHLFDPFVLDADVSISKKCVSLFYMDIKLQDHKTLLKWTKAIELAIWISGSKQKFKLHAKSRASFQDLDQNVTLMSETLKKIQISRTKEIKEYEERILRLKDQLKTEESLRLKGCKDTGIDKALSKELNTSDAQMQDQLKDVTLKKSESDLQLSVILVEHSSQVNELKSQLKECESKYRSRDNPAFTEQDTHSISSNQYFIEIQSLKIEIDDLKVKLVNSFDAEDIEGINNSYDKEIEELESEIRLLKEREKILEGKLLLACNDKSEKKLHDLKSYVSKLEEQIMLIAKLHVESTETHVAEQSIINRTTDKTFVDEEGLTILEQQITAAIDQIFAHRSIQANDSHEDDNDDDDDDIGAVMRSSHHYPPPPSPPPIPHSNHNNTIFANATSDIGSLIDKDAAIRDIGSRPVLANRFNKFIAKRIESLRIDPVSKSQSVSFGQQEIVIKQKNASLNNVSSSLYSYKKNKKYHHSYVI